ncbi:T cell receptor alpha, partial [Clarias magur]
KKEDPKYYMVKDQNNINDYCLATGFTEPNATNTTWEHTGKNKAEAAMFEGEGYYSRLILNETYKCRDKEVNGTCKSDSGNSWLTFNS